MASEDEEGLDMILDVVFNTICFSILCYVGGSADIAAVQSSFSDHIPSSGSTLAMQYLSNFVTL